MDLYRYWKVTTAGHLFGLLVFLGLTPARASAKMTEAEFVLANQLSEPIRVEFRDRSGKTLAEQTVKPRGEIALRPSRRIVVHFSGRESREYALPSALYLRSSDDRLIATLGGKWRVTVTDTPELGIAVIKAPSTRSVPDYNRPPLTFPMSPRKGSETFEQYKARLDRQYRDGVSKGLLATPR